MRTPRRRARAVTVFLAVAASSVLALLLGAGPALAADGRIDHVESRDGALRLIYSLPGVGEDTPDLSSVSVSVDGAKVPATATLASKATGKQVRRTAVLAIDVSNSMAENGKFLAAKRAASTFLRAVPDDLYVGIVTFAGTVTVAQEPTLDRAASLRVIDRLALSEGTYLYDGLRQAVRTSGAKGQRSVIVLSDGRDTSPTSMSTVTASVRKADVKVDVVALGQSARDERLLRPLSVAGDGDVISAADGDALRAIFSDEAQTIAKQVLVSATLPPDTPREASVDVSMTAGTQTYDRSAYVTLSMPEAAPTVGPSTNLAPVAPPARQITPTMMLAGVGAVGVALLVVLVVALGATRPRKQSLEERIAAYTASGAAANRAPTPPPTPQGMAAQAVGLASKALEGNRGLEAKLGAKLEAAALAFKPAEWLLLHASVAVTAFAALFLLSGGSMLMGLLGLVLGGFGAWVYLGMKQSRRLKAFNAQLASTLQLMAGSLQAGLSLTQGMDTIVREGAEPMAGEFRRALVETRLGVPIETALEGIADRMMSDDFEWTVMAIRIQREVGGNLAELLLNVAATLRERDYLRRQVKSLSAEGRFSAYILLAMPPAILAYEFVANRSYVQPLVSTPIGFVMLGIMVFLMVLGGFMMKKLIKLEV